MRLLFCLGILPLLLFHSGCFKDEFSATESYKEHMASAKRAAMNNDSQTERFHYDKALEAGTEIGWTEGTANVLIARARSFSGSQEYENAEASLLEAQSICTKGTCNTSIILSTYDNLFFLYFFSMKDERKAADLVNKLEKSDSSITSSSEFRENLAQYKADLKGLETPSHERHK